MKHKKESDSLMWIKPIEGSVYYKVVRQNLENAMHIEELPKSSHTWVRVLGQQWELVVTTVVAAPVQEYTP